jgi:hypothetical protein
VQWLTTDAGIAPGRLYVKGYGESRPVAQNTTPDGSDNPAIISNLVIRMLLAASFVSLAVGINFFVGTVISTGIPQLPPAEFKDGNKGAHIACRCLTTAPSFFTKPSRTIPMRRGGRKLRGLLSSLLSISTGPPRQSKIACSSPKLDSWAFSTA